MLQRFREGDRHVLAKVYREHAPALARMLRAAALRGREFAVLRSAMELENALLEVFARAFEPRARLVYDGIRPYESFLMGIARNYLLELSRTREHTVGLYVPESTSSFDTPADAQALLEDREVESLLHSFRTTLTPEERQLYELRFAQGLPQEEAARRMGLSRIQLRRRELNVKRRLLSFLQSNGYLRDVSASGWSFLRKGVS
ncbi:MAG: RNA polymerase sigma factor [Myxococcota bacterium]